MTRELYNDLWELISHDVEIEKEGIDRGLHEMSMCPDDHVLFRDGAESAVEHWKRRNELEMLLARFELEVPEKTTTE